MFSQAYNGDINTFILFPYIEQIPLENSSMELETYDPKAISEKLIIENVDTFLKEMIKWEVPMTKQKLGY